MKGALVRTGAWLWLMLLVATALPASAADLHFLASPVGKLRVPKVRIEAACYPAALPNDGRSEAKLTVRLEQEGRPLAGEKVRATITAGDGLLERSEAVTDASGAAEFHYRAGIMPQETVISVAAAEAEATAEVRMPLAAVSYLDLLLVSPEEYQKHLARQVAAAPIYKLSLSTFPDQLAADGGSLALITATLTLVDSGKPAALVPLSAELISGDGLLSSTQQATDESGRMSFSYSAGRQPGTAIVRITEPSTGLRESTSILLVEAGPARVQLTPGGDAALPTAHDGAMLPADGITALPLTVQVTDLLGSPLRGVEVRVEVLDHGCGRIELLDPVSDARGEVRCRYYCGAREGKVRLRAYAAAGLPQD